MAVDGERSTRVLSPFDGLTEVGFVWCMNDGRDCAGRTFHRHRRRCERGAVGTRLRDRGARLYERWTRLLGAVFAALVVIG
jgi:hypothetical protein